MRLSHGSSWDNFIRVTVSALALSLASTLVRSLLQRRVRTDNDRRDVVFYLRAGLPAHTSQP